MFLKTVLLTAISTNSVHNQSTGQSLLTVIILYINNLWWRMTAGSFWPGDVWLTTTHHYIVSPPLQSSVVTVLLIVCLLHITSLRGGTHTCNYVRRLDKHTSTPQEVYTHDTGTVCIRRRKPRCKKVYSGSTNSRYQFSLMDLYKLRGVCVLIMYHYSFLKV
jgi:hypothetical protein